VALIVAGCVAQQEGAALLKRLPEIDAVVGPQYVPYLHNVLEIISSGQQLVATAPMLLQEQNTVDDFHSQPIRGHAVRAWVNVIHGCNEHCTYCVVPGTRGMEQSRTMDTILQECLDLAAAGYREVTLLGQNIDAYGRDMVPKRTFADLLEYLNTHLPNPMRIRYATSHPRYFSDRVIDAVANLDKVCECFHMPFQAGDDEVLRNMRRGYTYESYMNIIRKIKSQAPDAAICADIIVGFPGETEQQFQKTLQLMEEVKFDNVNSFAYSARPNTEAALYTNQIPESVQSERLQRVQQLAMQHGYERSVRYLHRTVEVLVEDVNPRDATQVMGRTRQGRQVYFTGDLTKLRGEFVPVKITEARTWSLMGELSDLQEL
jgi:tRNA-2-methylthio-N6-dimethylallyladenosine synthase